MRPSLVCGRYSPNKSDSVTVFVPNNFPQKLQFQHMAQQRGTVALYYGRQDHVLDVIVASSSIDKLTTGSTPYSRHQHPPRSCAA
eukprot:4080288-Amphidinium_carterae.1